MFLTLKPLPWLFSVFILLLTTLILCIDLRLTNPLVFTCLWPHVPRYFGAMHVFILYYIILSNELLYIACLTFIQGIRRQAGDCTELYLTQKTRVILQITHPQIMCHQGTAAIYVKGDLRNFGPFANRVRLEPNNKQLLVIITTYIYAM